MAEWIPVTERLPNDGDRVLIAKEFMSHLRVDICYFAGRLESVDEYDFYGQRQSGFYDYDSEGYFERLGVKYWMPIPEPPKEVGNDVH